VYQCTLRRGSALYAMDSTCYHMGGPLLHADIEDVPGKAAHMTNTQYAFAVHEMQAASLHLHTGTDECTMYLRCAGGGGDAGSSLGRTVIALEAVPANTC
jgi:hypothetical protein